MSDRPTEPGGPAPTDPADLPARSLSEILEELAVLSRAQHGEASEMRSAVSELSRALARLFEMIRTDRHDQRERIATLERELAAARQQLVDLGVDPQPAPAPNDFDQLRAAAERLRVRTQQLVAEHGIPARHDDSQTELELGGDEVPASITGLPVLPDDPGAVDPVDGALDAGRGLADAGHPLDGADDAEVVTIDAPAPVPDDATVLRVLPGAGSGPAADLDVECDLPLAPAADTVRAPEPDPIEDLASIAEAMVQPVEPVGRTLDPEPDPAPARPADAPATFDAQPPPIAERPEPTPVDPRPAAKRSLGLRRRRIDARKLVDVEPSAALGSMVAAVDPLWTAGCGVDLVVAFTDGGAVRVAGGDRESLRVEEVEPGAPARCTVTATRRQLIPLFGRLDLTDEESTPLIHGSRRDADLLVGWFDRAQRLPVAPL